MIYHMDRKWITPPLHLRPTLPSPPGDAKSHNLNLQMILIGIYWYPPNLETHLLIDCSHAVLGKGRSVRRPGLRRTLFLLSRRD